MEEERQLRAVREKVKEATLPEIVEETQAEEQLPQEVGREDQGIDAMVRDELEVTRQLEQEHAAQAREDAMIARQIQEYEQEKAVKNKKMWQGMRSCRPTMRRSGTTGWCGVR